MLEIICCIYQMKTRKVLFKTLKNYLTYHVRLLFSRIVEKLVKVVRPCNTIDWLSNMQEFELNGDDRHSVYC